MKVPVAALIAPTPVLSISLSYVIFELAAVHWDLSRNFVTGNLQVDWMFYKNDCHHILAT